MTRPHPPSPQCLDPQAHLPFELSKELETEHACLTFVTLLETIAALRDPSHGCPWNLAQTHTSLARYLIEEAQEAAEVCPLGDDDKLCDELGDVLLQVILGAQVAADRGGFTMSDVMRAITAKMRRRHPHVFGTPLERAAQDLDSIERRWQEIKAWEKSAEGQAFLASSKEGHKKPKE